MNLNESPMILSFRDAVSLVSMGNRTLVQNLLNQEPAPYTPLERVYLQVEIACAIAQFSSDLNEDEKEAYWDKAAKTLAASQEALHAVPGVEDYFSKRSGTVRWGRPWTCWFLGNLAAYLSCPSLECYSQALHLLDERRMNIPWLRCQVLCDRAQALLQIQCDRAALAQYEYALACYQGALNRGEGRHGCAKQLFLGLAKTSERLRDYDRALSYAEQAQEIAPDQQTLLLLGHLYACLGNKAAAIEAYQEAFMLAQNAIQRVISLIDLARLCVEHHEWQEAKLLMCQGLKEDLQQIPARLQGQLYQICGKLAEALTSPPEACVDWYSKAIQAHASIAVLTDMAVLLERLIQKDHSVVATSWWRAAYHLLTQHITLAEPNQV